ncbi:MAG: peptidylprolyl isomerase [Verrucomicrobiae bacterium]|nr:peptidylprolyl isomerase [Verrucomicrobiae bacterium]
MIAFSPRFLLPALCALTLSSLAAVDAFAEDDAKKPAEVKVTDIEATIKTDKGDIKVKIYASKAPVTAANFLNLAKRDYYDGVSFHRVVEDFVIQGGDPSGTGRGGPGYYIENEIVEGLKHDRAGILSMARKREPDTNGSQFFITLGPTPHLDGGYSIFGEVVDGMEAVESIEQGDKILDIEVTGSTDALFAKMESRLDEWNAILDERDKAQKDASDTGQ